MNDRESMERLLREALAAEDRVESPACLDAETLGAWADGLLAGSERSSAEAHAARCARCQAMLAAMARTIPIDRAVSRSPIRKWLIVLGPATAAAAAVALWFAVDQRSVLPSAPEMREETPAATRPQESARLESAAPVERERQPTQRQIKPEGQSNDEARANSRRRAPADQVADARLKAERDDVAPRPESKPTDARKLRLAETEAPVAAPSPPGPPPPPPQRQAPATALPPVAETVQVAQGNQAAQARQMPPAAPMQTGQSQAAPSQQAAQARTDQVQEAGQRVQSDQAAGRTGGVVGGRAAAAADRVAAAAPANEGLLAFRTDAAFEIASPETSVRWRVLGGRTVQQSLDQGKTWTTQQTPVDTAPLIKGASPSSTVCWLVGRRGIVLRTTDGRTWQQVKFPEPVDLAAVTASDARSATVTTADGRTFITTDGGLTWTRQ